MKSTSIFKVRYAGYSGIKNIHFYWHIYEYVNNLADKNKIDVGCCSLFPILSLFLSNKSVYLLHAKTL